jgi:hypothetical protein
MPAKVIEESRSGPADVEPAQWRQYEEWLSERVKDAPTLRALVGGFLFFSPLPG